MYQKSLAILYVLPRDTPLVVFYLVATCTCVSSGSVPTLKKKKSEQLNISLQMGQNNTDLSFCLHNFESIICYCITMQNAIIIQSMFVSFPLTPTLIPSRGPLNQLIVVLSSIVRINPNILPNYPTLNGSNFIYTRGNAHFALA